MLAEVYSMVERGEHVDATDLLSMLSETMPTPEDGSTLKSDIVNGAGTELSKVAISDLEVLEFFASGRGRDALPLPGSNRIGAVAKLAKSQPERTLKMVENAINHAFPEADTLVDQVRTALDRSGLFARLDSYPQLRSQLVAKDLDLLDNPHLLKITLSERDALLAMVSEEALAARLIERLIRIDDTSAAALFMVRFPRAVDQAVLSRMAAFFAGRGPAVPSAWKSAVDTISKPSFVQRNVSKITSYSELGVLLAKAGPRTFVGQQSGAHLWVQALARSAVDVPDRQQTWILAHVLALALACPCHGFERGFEIAFERVHSDILTGQLSGEAFEFLVRQFPQVHWWQEWDSGYRLRLAVVNAYVRSDMDPKSFARLTRNQDLMNDLVGIADESKEGRSFLKRLAV
ncbi:hypothetical protein GCM10007989_14160 [Devosia pacifica]|uniref:Uncharacterized protein n=1 Tax=Devosia pacifica TaxID=1335967 RepID=A0A918S456_9HYPH|nr:hypothetical protein GCM10007989_14160 [Devosia pacifica]